MRPRKPLVSVLLPVRDGGSDLDEAMASLASQSFEDFEIIAVDDGSSDGTPAVLQGWASRDPRVVHLTQPASGLVAALESARAGARGKYLARMDADDLAAPRRIEAQYAFMEAHPDLAGCGCLVEYFPPEIVRDGAQRYAAWLNNLVTPSEIGSGIFVECPLAHPTFFLRATAVEEVGGYVDRGWPEDYDLVLRLWADGRRLGKVPETLLRWREGEGRLSRSDPRYAPDAFLACKVHYLRATLLQPGRPAVIWGAGPVGKAIARALLAEGTPVHAFVDLDPRKIGQEIHGAPVLDTAAGLSLRGPLHLAAVGQAGGRRDLVGIFEGAGMVALEDFVAVA